MKNRERERGQLCSFPVTRSRSTKGAGIPARPKGVARATCTREKKRFAGQINDLVSVAIFGVTVLFLPSPLCSPINPFFRETEITWPAIHFFFFFRGEGNVPRETWRERRELPPWETLAPLGIAGKKGAAYRGRVARSQSSRFTRYPLGSRRK